MSKQDDIKALLEAGAHFGHRTSRWNPKMRQYIYTKRGGIHIIDLVQTADHLQQAAKFAKQTTASGKKILFVGTKKHIAPAIREVAQETGMPHITERWFGGILTNFDTILRRIQYFKKLTQQLESGELTETYNKREITKLQEERDKMAVSFSGLADMEELPGAVFIADVVNEQTAVREANRLNIPIIGIVDTNGDPAPIDHVIPANDDAVKTVSLIAKEIGEAATSGKEEHAKAAAKPKTKQTAQKEKTSTGTKQKTAQSAESTKPSESTDKKEEAA